MSSEFAPPIANGTTELIVMPIANVPSPSKAANQPAVQREADLDNGSEQDGISRFCTRGVFFDNGVRPSE